MKSKLPSRFLALWPIKKSMKWNALALTMILSFYSFSLWADLYTETLPTGKSSGQIPSETGLQSGRYQIRQDQSEQLIYPKASILKPNSNKNGKWNKRPASESDAVPAILPVKKEEATADINKPEPVEPTIQEQVSDLMSGGRKKISEVYREQIHPDDIRMNKIEVDIGSGLFYNNAKANFSYRTYYSFAPNLSVGAKVWLTPLLGISGKYQSTYGEDVAATTNTNNRVAIKTEWVEAAIDLRKFYGFSRRSNSLQYGLIYSEYKFNPPANDGTRIALKTSGVGLYLSTRIPVAPSYSWTFGGELFPILSHSEIPTTLNLQSGASVSSSRVGLNFGGEFKMSRQNQIIWSLGIKIERNQYSGSANMTDPETGTTPTGVSVTNTWTALQLGYRWGQ